LRERILPQDRGRAERRDSGGCSLLGSLGGDRFDEFGDPLPVPIGVTDEPSKARGPARESPGWPNWRTPSSSPRWRAAYSSVRSNHVPAIG